MPYLVPSKTVKVTLPSNKDYWATVKVGLKYGDLKDYREYGGSGEHFTTTEKLKLSIVEWNLDDEAGNLLPIDDASIDALQDDDVIAIASATFQSEGDVEKKNSPKP